MGMLNRTKVLLASRGNLRYQPEQSVGVRAINAARLLDRIEIGQPAPVENQIVFSPDFGNSINRKANELINGNGCVKKQKGQHTYINQRRRQDYQQPGISEVFPTGSLQPAVLVQGFLRRRRKPVAP